MVESVGMKWAVSVERINIMKTYDPKKNLWREAIWKTEV